MPGQGSGTQAKPQRGRRKPMGLLQRREARDGYIFILPWLLGFLFFMLIPMLSSLFISFTYWDITTPMRFAGLSNYANLFKDDAIPKVLFNTLWYTGIIVPLSTVVGLAIAMLMNRKLRGISIFRAIFYLPSILPGVAVSIVWVWILNPEFGFINIILGWFGIQGPMWLDDPNWAMWGVILRAAWGAGSSMILFLAALQNVPPTYYEAAEIDGAGAVRRFFKITLPLITPTLLYHIITSFINAMQEYALFRVMTNGGPSQSTATYVFRLYDTAFIQVNMGYASAMAWVLFVIVLILTALLFKTSNKWVYYETGAGR